MDAPRANSSTSRSPSVETVARDSHPAGPSSSGAADGRASSITTPEQTLSPASKSQEQGPPGNSTWTIKDTPPRSASGSRKARTTSFSPITVVPNLSSPVHAQAALGRGRAPSFQAQTSYMASGSPISSNAALTTAQNSVASRGARQGHRSMPSTSHSFSFSDAPNNSNIGGTGIQTDAESVFSTEEDRPSQGFGPSVPQIKSRKSRLKLQQTQSAAGSSIGRASGGQLKPPSTAGMKGKLRTRSRSRLRGDTSSSGLEDGPKSARRGELDDDDTVNVLPVSLTLGANQGMDDDEVERRDRGEELVRRRMRERKKEKRETERRERKRRDEEIKRDRELQISRAQKITGAVGGRTGLRDSMGTETPIPALATSPEGQPSLSRRNTDPANLDDGSLPTLSRFDTLSRDSSGPTIVPSIYSPMWPPPTGSLFLSAAPTPESPFFPSTIRRPDPLNLQNRAISHAPSIASRTGELDAFSETDRDEEVDRVPELQSRDGSAAWRDEVARNMRGEEAVYIAGEESGPECQAQEDLEEEGEEEEGDDDDEDDDDDDDDPNQGVEYTLKDRQDAINIEHPFGLPIWKPALYKKSRSVTRHADQDLHLAPSYTAEYHLLPGNLLWTLLFGWWLAFLCVCLAVLLCCVPFGGAKYGRVIWELASYLFWPFGKYVERYEEGGTFEDLKGYDEISEDEDETVYDENGRMAVDIENAGSTWGRASGRSVASSGTVKHVNTERALGNSQPISIASALVATPTTGDGRSTTDQSKYKRSVSYAYGTPGEGDPERTNLLNAALATDYGAVAEDTKPSASHRPSSGSETEVAEGSPFLSGKQLGQNQDNDVAHSKYRVRALGRLSYWAVFYLLVAPVMLLVCVLSWGLVFTIPMAKLLWILIRNLGREPLALHFRSPSPNYLGNNNTDTDGFGTNGLQPHLEAGQPAPRHSKKTYDKSREMGRLLGPNSTIILCTYKAIGLKYYKYTVDGVNIVFINLLPLILFVIFDFFVIEHYVQKHQIRGFLAFISGQAILFILALLSVIPLSYFIGMAVASISAQSSIGMGAVINATFGSIIEIILYGIALTQAKAKLVEGSIVGSLLAGVLLMPGLSMIGGAVRRKEQRFNAKSAGVTSTMLIMAIIGILTPTLFYEIYGTFQLTCADCPPDSMPDEFVCRRCFYEHVDPVDDPFYRVHVRGLSYYCAVILVLSYLIGLWFSLRTHASQIWQNQQQGSSNGPPTGRIGPATAEILGRLPASRLELPHRSSVYKRLPQAVTNLLAGNRQSAYGNPDISFRAHGTEEAVNEARQRDDCATPFGTPAGRQYCQSGSRRKGSGGGRESGVSSSMQLPPGMTAEEVHRVFQAVVATASALQSEQAQQKDGQVMSTPQPILRHQPSHLHERETSRGHQGGEGGESDGHGGHDAPNWSRLKSYSVLLSCTILYAIIAEILVDVVDVVLDGSSIPEKFLGVTLFALVPNTTEFMNAISFAMNGNIALSMEIGSAYAIQVCLLQIPAMIAFTYFYGLGKDSMLHRAFTLVFPRWDALAIMFSVFLLTYTYIEARSNYYRGSILVLSYMVLLGGFYAAPANLDTEDDPLFSFIGSSSIRLSFIGQSQALFSTLFSR